MTDARKALADKIAGIPIGPFAILLGMNDDLHFSEIVAARNMIVAALHYEANALPGTREEVARAALQGIIIEIISDYIDAPHELTVRCADDILAALPPAPMPEREGMRAALEWYADEAAAAARYMAQGKTQTADALLAILTVLANDGGNRARAALAPHDKTEGR